MSSLTGNERILVIEDETSILELSTRILTRSGYRVTAVLDGMEAWEVFHADPDAFDLLFVDVMLPRLSGLRFGRRVRMLRPALPILYTSGFAPHGLPPDQSEDPWTAFVAKPYGPEALLRHLRSLLDRKRAAGAEA